MTKLKKINIKKIFINHTTNNKTNDINVLLQESTDGENELLLY